MSEREIGGETRPAAYDRVERELLGDSLDFDREVERLDAMGDRTRFAILYLLSQEGTVASGDLADALDRRQNDLYHHLNVLEEAGLVGKFRDGGSRVYELSPLGEGTVSRVFDAIEARAEG
ncbi:ArsR/SmtB family transcription factor [Halosimplex marinum]|uniref:ArsR/SmtB family transcription factor n=1 Tax=Halosimplex marinum TaxID=3396620 RepID=UPI003F578BCF